jgi:hypothetical protein
MRFKGDDPHLSTWAKGGSGKRSVSEDAHATSRTAAAKPSFAAHESAMFAHEQAKKSAAVRGDHEGSSLHAKAEEYHRDQMQQSKSKPFDAAPAPSREPAGSSAPAKATTKWAKAPEKTFDYHEARSGAGKAGNAARSASSNAHETSNAVRDGVAQHRDAAITHQDAAKAHMAARDAHERAASVAKGESTKMAHLDKAADYEEKAHDHKEKAAEHESKARGEGDWDEAKHPRDASGKFGG